MSGEDEDAAIRNEVGDEDAPNAFSYKNTTTYNIMDIDEFYRVIGNDLATKFGKKFQVDGRRPPTPSTLFNNSVFSHLWTIFYCSDHSSDLILSPNDKYSDFWSTFCTCFLCININQSITPLMQQYLTEKEINLDTDPVVFQGESDWHHMIGFFDEEHTIYWSLNINPKSVLFEYVLIIGENYSDASPTDKEYELIHLSEFDVYKNLISIYENYSGNSGCNDEDEDNNIAVLK